MLYKPLVSVIIPVFNRKRLIRTAIESVISQSFTNWECIVVDDGSTDKTIDVIHKYQIKDERIKAFTRNRLPKGAPTCRNIGVEQAKGEFIIFLDSDDYLLPFCFKNRLLRFHKNPNNDFLIFPMGIKKIDIVKKSIIPKSEDYLINFLSADLPWSIMCPIWKKDVLIQLNGFTEGYPRFNDPELMIRALLKDNVKYSVFKDMNYDCIYFPSEKLNAPFSDRSYEALFLFIPDMVNHLLKNNRLKLRTYLSKYLFLYFKYIIDWNEKNQIIKSLKLIGLFKKQGIINGSKMRSLKMRLLLYSVSNYFLKNPIDKLTQRSNYVSKES